MQHVVARAALGVAAVTAVSTLVLNAWAVPSINASLLPQVTELLARLLQREVRRPGSGARRPKLSAGMRVLSDPGRPAG